MKKIAFVLLVMLIICALVIFAIIRHYNIETIINNIEKSTGLEIKLVGKGIWDFYPLIAYSNSNVDISQSKNNLQISETNLNIHKSYWPTSPIYANLKTPIINFQGMEMRNVDAIVKYTSNIIIIESLEGKIIEGKIKLKGKVDLDDSQPFNFQGEFDNISLNSLLKQSRLATWDRINIKLSSPDFTLSGEGNENSSLLSSLNGVFSIKGSLYFVSSDDERFGAAILSLLAEKIPNLSSLSRSVDFLISNYANTPSSLEGTIKLHNGFMTSKEILIANKFGKSTVEGSYNYINDTIDGTIYFYEKNENILEASLKGNINNPQILVGGKIFSDKENEPAQDINKLLSDGINSFIEKLLTKDE